jgi:hypothetical protein
LDGFLTESKRVKLCDVRRILAALPEYPGARFSDIPRLQEEPWFSLWFFPNYVMIHWPQMINFLMEGGETEALAALNRLDIARLNDVIVIFTRFIKCVEGNFISYLERFPKWQKPLVDLRSMGSNKYAETLMQAVSARFSQTTDLNVIFVCCLVASAGKKYWGAIERPSLFSASIEAM